jgi:hypothetical protein
MSYQFNRWTITLGAQVRALYKSMLSKDPEQLKREIETYETELQQLYAYAEQHNVDLIEYYHPFVEIEDRLFLIRECIQDGQANME